ncbi:MAG: N-6 DNA methylase [Bacteroidia bacterium]|nr:N-6 DNA methylase [Bacteroidia bacterium]
MFDFKKDKISKSLIIENKIVKTIINELYYPESPYEFSVLSVEILGSAYEQFLGKVIRITPGHIAKVEEKPEVRKAGGVYYTPQYVVEYIVKNTVGKLIENKTPKEISKIKIVDPACGSGSFLLGAYQYLLDWHKNYYTSNGKISKGNKGNPLTPEGNLATAEKKRILLNNIFGVDIDVNAVEVTKLSLLLKCMEGETQASINNQLKMFHERVLPTLDENIKSGNSLVDTDFYDNQLDFGDEKKIKPFNWQRAFPEVFRQGGFDAVIGNPPYGANFNEQEKSYLLFKFRNQNYQLDSYLIFLEQSFKALLKENGKFGMIIPNPWLTNLLQKNLRKFIFENSAVKEIVHFKQAVFPTVTVDTEIVILSNEKEKNNEVKITVVEKGNSLLNDKHTIITHNQKEWIAANGDVVNIFQSESDKILFRKILKNTKPLVEYFIINVGIKPYQVGKGKPKQKKQDVEERIFDSNKKENKLFRKYLRGKDIYRYVISPLEERYLKFGEWLAEPRPAANFDAPEKIFMRQTGDSLIGTLDTKQFLCLNNMHVLVPKETNKPDVRYFLGLINSTLLNWYYQTLNPEKGEALAEVKKSNVAQLPIKLPDSKNQNEIEKLVNQLLQLNKEKAETKLAAQVSQLQGKIDYCEDRINQIVYQLYELTEEEIKIIEENGK